MNRLDKILSFFPKVDKMGNKLSLDEHKCIILRLQKNMYKSLCIGNFISKYDFIIYIKDEKEKHIYRNLGDKGAWSINWQIVQLLEDKDIILLKAEKKEGGYNVYISTVKNLKEKGEFLNYKQSGYELKKYMRLEDWEIIPYEEYTKDKKKFLGKYLGDE